MSRVWRHSTRFIYLLYRRKWGKWLTESSLWGRENWLKVSLVLHRTHWVEILGRIGKREAVSTGKFFLFGYIQYPIANNKYWSNYNVTQDILRKCIKNHIFFIFISIERFLFKYIWRRNLWIICVQTFMHDISCKRFTWPISGTCEKQNCPKND